MNYSGQDLFWAWLAATLFSGVPSTLYFLATGGDLWLPIHAVGVMLVPANSPSALIFLAAALVHGAVSLFWTVIVARLAPAKHVPVFCTTAGAAIAMIDLRVIAPMFFPEVARLYFWPQFADHLAWGLLLGGTLAVRRSRKPG